MCSETEVGKVDPMSVNGSSYVSLKRSSLSFCVPLPLRVIFPLGRLLDDPNPSIVSMFFHPLQHTSLHSMCACPGRCLLDAKEDAGIRFDSSDVGGSGLSVGAIVGIA